jgi:hypothetical protein
MQDMESGAFYTQQYDTDSVVMKARGDEAMSDWEDVSAALKQARHKKEFTEGTAKKYWKMKAADFVREKRASVLQNNRKAKKQATRRANREGMATPPPQETPEEEEEVKSRITNLWWLENELRALDLRAQKALTALTPGTQNMESVRTHEYYAQMKDETMRMTRMQKGMAVSKGETEALAAAVAVIQCINTGECWKEKMRDMGVEREELGHEVGIARSDELTGTTGAGRVYVVMGAPNAVRNAVEARVLGTDMLPWRAARDETRKEILPEGMAAPTAGAAADLREVVGSWLQLGGLSSIAKRQTANHVAYGKRVRSDKERPCLGGYAGAIGCRGEGQVLKLWEEGGTGGTGFRKTGRATAPAEANAETPKAVRGRLWGEKTAGRPSVALPALGQQEAVHSALQLVGRQQPVPWWGRQQPVPR